MKIKTCCAAVILMGILAVSYGQGDPLWGKWSWLMGQWIGEGSGQPGKASGWFSLEPELDNRILVRKNHAEYPATKDREQVIHDDLMIIHPGTNGEADKAVYFDNEGHVIYYAIAYLDEAIGFTSEKIPDSPVFRLTYYQLGADTINVKFEMSQDGENFMTYTEGKCFRKK